MLRFRKIKKLCVSIRHPVTWLFCFSSRGKLNDFANARQIHGKRNGKSPRRRAASGNPVRRSVRRSLQHVRNTHNIRCFCDRLPASGDLSGLFPVRNVTMAFLHQKTLYLALFHDMLRPCPAICPADIAKKKKGLPPFTLCIPLPAGKMCLA